MVDLIIVTIHEGFIWVISNTLVGSHHFQETLINFLMTSWLIRRIQPMLYFWSSSTSDHSVGSPPHVRADPPLARQVHAGTGFQGLMKTWWALEWVAHWVFKGWGQVVDVWLIAHTLWSKNRWILKIYSFKFHMFGLFCLACMRLMSGLHAGSTVA